jgi:hypothetical protein
MKEEPHNLEIYQILLAEKLKTDGHARIKSRWDKSMQKSSLKSLRYLTLFDDAVNCDDCIDEWMSTEHWWNNTEWGRLKQS